MRLRNGDKMASMDVISAALWKDLDQDADEHGIW